MGNITVYSFDNLKDEYRGVFAGVYNDFCQKAASDYMFELTPLPYEEFLKSVDEKLVHCIVLFEQQVPTGFLTYTTVISYSIELNLIHVIGDDNAMQKRCLLLQKFMEETSSLTLKKVVTYAILGKQEQIVPEISKFGFSTVKQSVLKFDFQNAQTLLSQTSLPALKHGFSITSWQDRFFSQVAEIIFSAFKNSSDSKFDPRFCSIEGVRDILYKIVSNLYGEFLDKETKILLYREKPVGICFSNLTNAQIANIPLVAIKENYRNKSYGKYLLKTVVTDVYSSVMNGERRLQEINVTCDSDYVSAYKMYTSIGFTELYNYHQAYRLPS
jgi:GNAT superfamily N-acetyltransferase